MDISKIEVSEPRSRNLATHVDVTLKLENGDVVHFTAVPQDTLDHGREIYQKAVEGAYGEITQAPDTDGLYIWKDGAYVLFDDTLTQEQKIAAAEATRKNLLDSARETIGEWQSELTLGTITEDEKKQLIAWLAYIKILKAVDTSTAPNITWPDVPASTN